MAIATKKELEEKKSYIAFWGTLIALLLIIGTSALFADGVSSELNQVRPSPLPEDLPTTVTVTTEIGAGGEAILTIPAETFDLYKQAVEYREELREELRRVNLVIETFEKGSVDSVKALAR